MSVQDDILRRFQWIDGHADLWRLFGDATLFAAIVTALADPFREHHVTAVCGIEARGFILGAAVARDLGSGFVAIRKAAGLYPGPKHVIQTRPDYRGNEHLLRLQQRAIGPGDCILLVDDWAERGSQMLGAVELIRRCGGEVVGISLIVDELDDEVRRRLPGVKAILRADELPPDT